MGDISSEGIHAGRACAGGAGTGLALVGTLLAGSSVDEVTVRAVAGGVDVIEEAASHAGGTLVGIGGGADRTVEGRTGVALEGLGGIEVVS